MTSDQLPYAHPITRCVAGLREALDQAAGSDPLYLTPQAKREALVALTELESRVAALRLAVIAAAGDVAEEAGARNVASWLAPATRADYPQVAAAERFAACVEARWPRVKAGLADGGVSLAQGRVVVRALERLASPAPPGPDGTTPPPLGREVLERAEAWLVQACATLTPTQLRAAGDRILETIAPEIAEDEERKALEREEAKAAAETRLTITGRGDGTADIKARVPEAIAARLKGYLDGYTSPRHHANTKHGDGKDGDGTRPGAGGAWWATYVDPATGQRLPRERMLGEAFCAFLEHADPARMPIQAGGATTCVVTMPLADLQAGVGVATLPDGTRISPGQFRRLACTSGIIPAVLGTDSEVLDLGRESRFFKKAHKRALALQHPTCRAAGCTVPAEWCEAHHWRKPWAQGGTTDLKDGKLLCPWHHHRAHDPAYHTTHHPDGTVTFHRRT